MPSTDATRTALDKREFLEAIGEILELPPNTLHGHEMLASLGWDSMSVIAFQAFLDEKFGARADCVRTAACETFDDLFELTVDIASHETICRED
jgi:acyl carrier protein